MIFAITTLGCKVNQYESQLLREALVERGWCEQPFSSPGADVYIVNTCTVTHRSDAQARNLIRRALKFGARVIATGCQAKVYPDEIRRISHTVAVMPFEEMGEALGVSIPRRITGFCGHGRAFVNIQQGCSNHCTFCIVPGARGVPWSRPAQEIVEEISGLYDAGFREIVLSGINIGLYEGGVAALLERVLACTAMPRVRISSIEPWTLTDELIRLVSEEPRMCRHLHIPLQSGSDTILRRMGRPYTARYYRGLVENIRSLSSEMSIGSDVIVGFPGEGEHEFEETHSLLRDIGISYLHVFPFSPRPGTPAAAWSARPDSRAVKERVALLRDLSLRKREEFIRSQLGREAEVLVTHAHERSFQGITSHYLHAKAAGRVRVNDRVRVLLEEHCEGYVRGRLLG
ncbi:MAG: Threonylcarbamoyladenosine tRNA methylthiotransferase MtaB [Deltaproteobacteria bacterium ADurb.BinA179]|jgi:threonylcarbamoyladenosine tRNA methylthiotransferase MtaB|nr:MiaB/RimO family radical SAM methylthiotransferase [Deltaproteobacteria bacterium]NLW67819.1 MiaB/RimO family radical SAM methylthiotransferase [Bacteriovoracaceae bacterium]OPZ27868.1 MAG: Threonylcarbamoyladenosine tRNA methylthiotransferase MtaB [Deltaproteobacteria bacterium ADurb.BinA179]HRR21067.1 MiaB/RimO family radical SAM methylthiotransferase [Desulfomonilia bacterium]HNU74408.1 MiaB/RimO family radical SAM methylthiotransferase [Deltaproteobacteria bacterium]